MDPTAVCEQFWKDLFLDISKLLSLANDTGVGWLCRGWALHWRASVWVSGLILRLSPSRQTDLFHSWEQNTVVIWQIVQHGRRADRTWEAGSWKAFRKKPCKLLGLLWWLKQKEYTEGTSLQRPSPQPSRLSGFFRAGVSILNYASLKRLSEWISP